MGTTAATLVAALRQQRLLEADQLTDLQASFGSGRLGEGLGQREGALVLAIRQGCEHSACHLANWTLNRPSTRRPVGTLRPIWWAIS